VSRPGAVAACVLTRPCVVLLVAPAGSVGVVRFHPHVARDALQGLDLFSHVWLIFVSVLAFAQALVSAPVADLPEGLDACAPSLRLAQVFNRNTNKHKSAQWVAQASPFPVVFPAKVRPPLLGGAATGLFSTRTPHRPNPVGLSLCRIERIDMTARELHVSGLDLCDGTPVLDVKPLVPGDMPLGPVRFAPWVSSEDHLRWSVHWSVPARRDLEQLLADGACEHFASPDALVAAAEDVLRLDVRAVHQGRGASAVTDVAPTRHQCVVDGVQIFFLVDPPSSSVLVQSAQRYDKSVLPPL
jgi:tRNA (Thr-GGU) A37 N-methylase